MKISEIILRLLFPPKCIACGKLLDYFSAHPYCDNCHAEMSLAQILQKSAAPVPNVDRLFVMYTYTNECVQQSVFHAKKTFSAQFAHFYLNSCKKLFEKHNFISEIDLITFVTRRSSEKRREGIDQAEQMARIMSRLTKIPYVKALIRTRKSKKQRMLSRVERAENVRGIFSARLDLKNKHVLLLDDVMTTGSSLSECAHALKKAGARSVSVIVFSA